MSRNPPTDHTVRWRGGWARLGPWRGQAEVAYLSIGAERPPGPETVERCLEVLRRHGYSAVVTNALTPADSLPFVDAGFVLRERLHLLGHDMTAIGPVVRPTRRARQSDRPAVLDLDAAAFDGFWQLDPAGLDDAIRATPSARFRIGESDGRTVAYAISGRAGAHGYLQRIAVDPEQRRRGWGRSIVNDALAWLAGHGVSRTLVNTQLHNDTAMALYLACGFAPLPFSLCVLGLAL